MGASSIIIITIIISDDKRFCEALKNKIDISDVKIERRFDDSMSSLSSSKYMIELYIVVVV